MAKIVALFGKEDFASAASERLKAAGYGISSDAASADIVVSYCETQQQIEDLYFGDEGFVSHLNKGALLVDLSPASPNLARDISSVALVSGLNLVEAPLVVRDITLEQCFGRENLFCYVAGEEDVVAGARDFLDVLVSDAVATGGAGSAQLAKAAHTLQVAAQVISTVEANALYHAVHRFSAGEGVPDAMPAAFACGNEGLLKAVQEKRFTSDFTVELFLSEVSAALTTADDADLIVSQAESALHLLELLAIIGGSDLAVAALSLVFGEDDESRRAGLDWNRANEVYRSHDHGDEDADEAEYDDDDLDDYGDFFTFDYSSN